MILSSHHHSQYCESEMVEANIVLTLLQTVSIMVGIGYYITTLRNQQKNQKMTAETRKIQLLLEMNQEIIDSGTTDWIDMIETKWENYEDFSSKYGYEADPELYKKRIKMWRRMNIMGLLIRDGLIDIPTYHQYLGAGPILIWKHFKEIIEEQRARYDDPEQYMGMEIIANELDNYRMSLGLSPRL